MKRTGIRAICTALFLGCILFTARQALAQLDQGTITGVVQDQTGAVVPGAKVTLTDTDTGLVLQSQSNASGIYTFSPIKIGHYSVSASAPGFKTTTQLHLQLNVQERLNAVLTLPPGTVSQTVTVSTAPPLLQTQQGSVSQVVSTRAINNTPLNGRNWIYIAQLTAGVAPAVGSRGAGTGDFVANGQRAAQNNFILDGVDNNVNVVDFMAGLSYTVRPPPDALAEFKLDTSAYSAEYGHSAGAVLNAAIKSGTNQIHGDLWEYFRNDALDTRDWDALSIPEYRQNQFGATLGFPIIRNKLFFFGDAEADRIVYGSPMTITVPTAKMVKGDFSELLNTSLTGSAKPIQLYQPNSGGGTGGTATLSCNGQNNVFCPAQIDAVAQNLLSLYPKPNTNNGRTYSNYTENITQVSNTFQWDARMDWNISQTDQIYSRFSYLNIKGFVPAPLGELLDGSNGFGNGATGNLSDSFMASETHIFNPNLTNELEFAYSYVNYTFLQSNYNKDVNTGLGLGGVPPINGDGYVNNGGTPLMRVGGIQLLGTHNNDPSDEHMNTYQILDNVTKIVGNHSLKFGVDFQSLRTSTLETSYPRGEYTFGSILTSNSGASFTGYGVADFLADQMDSGSLSNMLASEVIHWYRGVYAQDDWRVNPRLTLNLGLRYDYYQPQKEEANRFANFLSTGPLTPGGGTGVYILPTGIQNKYPLSPAFLAILAKDNITVETSSNPRLTTGQKYNFAPRLGFAFSVDPKTVIFGGSGIFYGGLEPIGGINMSFNYPFAFTDTFPMPSGCVPNSCPSNGVTLETGFAQQIAEGLGNSITNPQANGTVLHSQTPYTVDYNLMVQRALSNNLVASMGYVGNESRHLIESDDGPNYPAALQAPGSSTVKMQPFPDLAGGSGVGLVSFHGVSTYNGLQTKLEKRFADGLEFLATYTWSHSMTDSPAPLGTETYAYRNPTLIPIIKDYQNDQADIRNRVTFNGFYELPFGRGRAHMNQSRLADLAAGGWAADLTFAAQSGSPITISPNITTQVGGGAHAILRRDPYAAGGNPDPTNPKITCATSTRNKTHWFNPCAFANPSVTPIAKGTLVTDYATVVQHLGPPAGQINGPGYEQVSMSLFKNFDTFREQYLQFRVDIFNVFNTPAYGNPGTGINTNGGQITGARSMQSLTPHGRFFQLSAKYVF